MKYTPSSIRKLSSTNALEVEHIIEAAFLQDEKIALELESLSIEQNWSYDIYQDGLHVVPLAKWAKFANIFIREGYRGLVQNYFSAEDFSLKFLEEYKTVESVEAVYSIAQKISDEISSIKEIASALNLLLSFKDRTSINEDLATRIRELLHNYFSYEVDDITLAVIVLALRGVGDSSSVELILKQRALSGAWEDTAKVSIKAIKKRIRENA